MKIFLLNLIYVLTVFFIKIRFNISFTVPFAINIFLFLAGGALGFLLFYLDYFLYPFFAEKEDELAAKTKEYFDRKDFTTGIKFIEINSDKMKFHPLKTAINLTVLIIATYFVYISSGSLFGAGVGFGLLFHFLFRLLNDQKNPLLLNQWFEQIKKPIEYQYQQWFVYAVVGLTILISL